MLAEDREIVAENPRITNWRPERGRTGLLVTCCAVNALYALYFGGIGVVMPAIGATFHINAATQGRIFPANFAGMIASVLISGVLSDRFGRKSVLLGGTILYALGLLLFGFAPDFGLALLAAPLMGAGGGCMIIMANALIADLYPERRAVLLNLAQILFGAGAAIGPSLATFLLASGASWRFLYLALATASLGALIALFFQPGPKRSTGSSALRWSDLHELLRHPAFGLLCVMQAFYAGAEVGFFSWMPTYFRTMAGGAALSGIVVTVFWTVMTIGRIIAGTLLERLPLMPLGIGMATGGAVMATLALLMPTPWLCLVFVALTGLSFAGIYSLVLAEASHRFAHRTGTVFGGIAALSGVGNALVPWAVGAIGSSALGWRMAIGLSPLLSLAVMANFLLLKRIQSTN